MAITLTFNFDDTWAARLQPIIERRVQDIHRHPITLALLEARGLTSVDELTPIQKAKLRVLFVLLTDCQVLEGDIAERDARQDVIDDVRANFPLDID